VMDAIHQLNYVPNTSARSLRSGRTRRIGLLIPDAHNPFFWEIVSGAEDEANLNGYTLLIATTSMDPDREVSTFQALLTEHLDGIIPLLTYPEDSLDELKTLLDQGFPLVLFNTSSKFLAADRMRVHYEDSAQALMKHLIDLGHRRIAMICGIGRAGLGSDRVRVYHESLQQAGIEPDPRYFITTRNTLQDGFKAAQQLLQLTPRPTALIGINDLIAFGATQAALQSGLRLPDDLSVAGFDDIQLSSLLSPPLTTGQADGEDIGRQCVRLILQRMASPDLPPQTVHLPTQLIIRASTGPVPAEIRQPLAGPTP
jgi:DNA-binding LacI/PurR family transcriptional regulator